MSTQILESKGWVLWLIYSSVPAHTASGPSRRVPFSHRAFLEHFPEDPGMLVDER